MSKNLKNIKNKEIEKIYYDIKNSNYLSSIKKLYQGNDKKININDVKYWLQNQDIYTLFKNRNIHFKRSKFVSSKINRFWAIDLADMRNIKKYNNNISYLLVVIDVLSKFGWALPITDKKPSSIIIALNKIINNKSYPEVIISDCGREFDNNVFKKYLRDKNINHYICRNTEVKSAVAERFIRTIKEKLYKYMFLNNTKIYFDVLDNIVYNYNNSVHSQTLYKPINVNKKNQKKVFLNLYKERIENKYPKYNINDKVRILNIKNIFDKGYKTNFTEEIFKINKILNTLPFPRYQIKDLKNNIIIGSFYEKELSKII
jgi:hypothetical protein